MSAYSPSALARLVEEAIGQIGTTAFVTSSKSQRLREMWCAAKFGLGYSNHFEECSIEIESENENREYDFHLVTEKSRLPFQLAEVLDSGRRRGDEYRQSSREQIVELLNEGPGEGAQYVARRVQEELIAKAGKRYSKPEELHILLYLNLRASSIPWASVAGAAEEAAAPFASVWLVTQDLFCCVHGGTQWHGLVGWRVIENASS